MTTKVSDHAVVVIISLGIALLGAVGTNIGAYANVAQAHLQAVDSERRASGVLSNGSETEGAVPSDKGIRRAESAPIKIGIVGTGIAVSQVQPAIPASIAQRYPNCEGDARTDPEQLFPPNMDDGEDLWGAYCSAINMRKTMASGTEL